MPFVHGPKTVYALVDPRDARIRYIGASQDPEQRYKAHRGGGAGGSHEWQAWWNDMRDDGVLPDLRILSESRDDWAEEEARLQRKHRKDLLNVVIPKEKPAQQLDVRPAVAAALRSARKASGLSAETVAQLTNKSPTTIYRYEEGTRAPSVNDLANLAATYEAPVADFFPTDHDIQKALRMLRPDKED